MLGFYVNDLGLRKSVRDDRLMELRTGDESTEPILILHHDEKSTIAPADAAGLYHYALLVPDRKSLATAYLALEKKGVIFDGYADHLVSEALYLTDPEGNGIEIYADRPRYEWKFDEDGVLQMATLPMDTDSLLRELSGSPSSSLAALPEDTRIGHMHIKVSNLNQSITFYRDLLGLDLVTYWGNAAFLSAGGYHHHIGMNTWQSFGGPKVKSTWMGLQYFTLKTSRRTLGLVSSRLNATAFMHGQDSDALYITDPDGIDLILRSNQPFRWGHAGGD